MTLPPHARPRLLFIVTEDWFFLSHFVGMGKAAVEAGFEVFVAARASEKRQAIEAQGIHVIDTGTDRQRTGPLALLGAVLKLRQIIADVRPDIVHAIALHAILTGGIAGRLCNVPSMVLAPTGLGFLWSSDRVKARLGRFVLRTIIGRLLNRRNTAFLFENPDDARELGLDPNDKAKITLVRGAGVDPALFPATPLLTGTGLRLALVARMIASKRIADAVEAVRLAQTLAPGITLDLYGAPDPNNPVAIGEAQLRAWSALPGITWHGATNNILDVWTRSDAAILISTGEGLPRSLVEALASARAIITTDAPGNRIVVEDGVNGLLVPPGDVEAAAHAVAKLAGDRELLRRMGKASRARFEDGFTLQAVTTTTVSLYRRLIAARRQTTGT